VPKRILQAVEISADKGRNIIDAYYYGLKQGSAAAKIDDGCALFQGVRAKLQQLPHAISQPAKPNFLDAIQADSGFAR
jgi:hypothetical protein